MKLLILCVLLFLVIIFISALFWLNKWIKRISLSYDQNQFLLLGIHKALTSTIYLPHNPRRKRKVVKKIDSALTNLDS
jgi:hypothetical protein